MKKELHVTQTAKLAIEKDKKLVDLEGSSRQNNQKFEEYPISISKSQYQSLEYLFNIIPTSVRSYNTRNANNIPQFKVKHNFFQNSFFPSVVIESNKLEQNIRNSEN